MERASGTEDDRKTQPSSGDLPGLLQPWSGVEVTVLGPPGLHYPGLVYLLDYNGGCSSSTG